MDSIILPNISITACHGVYDEEKTTPQQFRIMVQLWLDLEPATQSDDVTETVHYGQLYLRIRQFAEENSFNLIETLAGQVVKLALEYDKVEEVLVRVEKCAARSGNAVFPAIVELRRKR